MICTIHQPNYIPYLGFFQKFKQSDVFVVYDTAQYNKNDWRNRNRVKTANGPAWLTIPVSFHLGQRINEVTISNWDFVDKHKKTLEINYKKAPYFNTVFPELEKLYSNNRTGLLVDFILPFQDYFFSNFDSGKKVVLASSLGLDLEKRSTEALVEIVTKSGCEGYLAGADAGNYMDESLFEKAGIKLLHQHFTHPTYPQLWGDFLPYMSAVDALFNLRPQELYRLL
jgi:hypothetical protein